MAAVIQPLDGGDEVRIVGQAADAIERAATQRLGVEVYKVLVGSRVGGPRPLLPPFRGGCFYKNVKVFL